MKNITIREIVSAVDGVFAGDESVLDMNISGVEIDSRQVKANYIFVAIKGENVDGHSYVTKAMELGALCCITERPIQDANCIVVKSSTKALQEAAKYYRSKLNIKVVGITGSVGKTSTKESVYSVLKDKFKTYKTQGNFNNDIGLPLTIFQTEEYHEVLVLEMGISDFGEMHVLADIGRPDICIITNIGCCHLENLKNRDGILKAKSEMFDFISDDTVIILNGDDDKLVSLKDVKGIEPIFFGVENTSANVYATDINMNSILGTDCVINDGDKKIKVHIPVPGKHMVYNACAGYLVGKTLGLSEGEIATGISNIETISGRNNIINNGRYIVIDDCYNANPVSMKASIDVLDSAPGRRIAVLGDMFELGENEKALHREVGEYLSTKNIEMLFATGELAKELVEGASSNSELKISYFENREEMIESLKNTLADGDVVLVKASHGMEYSKVVKEIRE